jgi:hypothetical protein
MDQELLDILRQDYSFGGLTHVVLAVVFILGLMKLRGNGKHANTQIFAIEEVGLLVLVIVAAIVGFQFLGWDTNADPALAQMMESDGAIWRAIGLLGLLGFAYWFLARGKERPAMPVGVAIGRIGCVGMIVVIAVVWWILTRV